MNKRPCYFDILKAISSDILKAISSDILKAINSDILKAISSARIRKEKEQKEKEEREFVARKKGERENLRLKREKICGSRERKDRGKEKEREEKYIRSLLKKIDLEIEAKRIESTKGERVKSSLDMYNLKQKFKPKVETIAYT
ncbi:hypothetical protein AVEN_34289-1 [Araneus ventricosus]|uniref:Uncharacterized protein n=1 Tax=Araneus ventricosus TaxID=182803 RepID=A0A4Y2K166_ARAVE|nr:hypothetical protein AVEN_34289-1 [Araneus ventricosus]